jgi:xanthine dehydrogenase accessory factor
MDIIEELHNRRKAGLPYALATIVRTAGASPRATGAKMLVYPDGNIAGTIGGGTFEKLVIDDCLRLMESDERVLLKTYRFAESGADATGMACGGEAEVFMEAGAKPKKLIIFGGGHICRDLVRLADGSGFLISIIDDRADILSAYSQSINTIQTDAAYQKDFPALDRDCFVVIVTRSHTIDHDILKRVMEYDCGYIGMIGSRTKIAKLFASLEKSGVARKLLDRVHAPIGLNIKGEGPYEIAVSILAELIAAKHGITRSEK